jgi:alkanesulfonate monooxygenase
MLMIDDAAPGHQSIVELASMSIRLFSTCPPSSHYGDEYGSAYLRKVREVAEWSDDAGLEGILVYTDNSLADPWLVSQAILSSTSSLAPLVAVQPAYMHPYTAAKMVTTFSYLYNRHIYLNMVAGGFRNDLIALDDHTEHDGRYDRLVEYVSIMRLLFSEPGPVSFTGTYFTVRKLSINPRIPPGLIPEVFVSGTSAAGLAAAREIGATSVSYPGTPSGETTSRGVSAGIRIGIIARPESEQAWRIAYQRFPVERKGKLTHAIARRLSDSAWYEQLSELGDGGPGSSSPYWLVPFKNYKTFCPYLVGSYDEVRGAISTYVREGFQTFILDVPPSREELQHTAVVFAGHLDAAPVLDPAAGIR